jgi:TPR repeat protein
MDTKEILHCAAETGEGAVAEIQTMLEALFKRDNKLAPVDPEGLRWIQSQAEKGNAGAQVHLGHIFYDGAGVRQDYAEARKWFLKAADQSVVEAQSMLGLLYASGNGVRRNFTAAANWFQKAADQGSASARRALDLITVTKC